MQKQSFKFISCECQSCGGLLLRGSVKNEQSSRKNPGIPCVIFSFFFVDEQEETKSYFEQNSFAVWLKKNIKKNVAPNYINQKSILGCSRLKLTSIFKWRVVSAQIQKKCLKMVMMKIEQFYKLLEVVSFANENSYRGFNNSQKMKCSIKDFFSKCD